MKSSRSGGNDGGDCVEVGFVKSSKCADASCVEVGVAAGLGAVLLRDSKDPNGPVLQFTAAEWLAFREGVRAGEFG